MIKQSSNLSEQEYKTLMSQYSRYEQARQELCGERNYVTVEEQTLLPPCPTSDEISMIEVYEFRHNPPKRYFAYVTSDLKFVTTWTGEILGAITWYSPVYRSNMGDERVNIRIKTINGLNYSGTFYRSAGDYCRIRLIK